MEKLKAIIGRIFLDQHPEHDETHSATREAMMCPPYLCKGANVRLCDSCKEARKPLDAVRYGK